MNTSALEVQFTANEFGRQFEALSTAVQEDLKRLSKPQKF
jgi:hypothetical protein